MPNGGIPLAGSFHFKAIRIFTRNGDESAKPVVNHKACARAHDYHGGFSFHAAFQWGAALEMPTGIYGRCSQ